MAKAQGGSHNHQLHCVKNSFMGGMMENRNSAPFASDEWDIVREMSEVPIRIESREMSLPTYGHIPLHCLLLYGTGI